MSFSGTKGYLTKPKPGVMLNPLHPLSRGLVGCWLFNEGAGSLANDISGYNNYGTLKNMTPNVQGSGWGGSKFVGGLHFDGTNDYVEVPHSASINLDFSWTISAIIKTGSTADLTILEKNRWSDRNYQMFISTADHKVYVAYNSGATFVHTPSTIVVNDGKWHHVVGVFNDIDNSTKIYIDGVDVTGTTVNSGEPDVAVGTLRIGMETAAPFLGNIDSIRIYNRTFSLAEAKQLYYDPFCNLLQVPIRRYSVAVPPVGVIMNQFQRANIGADLYNGVFA